MKKLILIAALFLSSCGPEPKAEPKNQELQRKAQLSASAVSGVADWQELGNSHFRTIKYDGHYIIEFGGYHKGGIIHHPDCPCLLKVEK